MVDQRPLVGSKLMASTKFDDCAICRFRRRPSVCNECDFGEQFEDAEVEELNFNENSAFIRSSFDRDQEDEDNGVVANMNRLFDELEADELEDDEDED